MMQEIDSMSLSELLAYPTVDYINNLISITAKELELDAAHFMERGYHHVKAWDTVTTTNDPMRRVLSYHVTDLFALHLCTHLPDMEALKLIAYLIIRNAHMETCLSPSPIHSRLWLIFQADVLKHIVTCVDEHMPDNFRVLIGDTLKPLLYDLSLDFLVVLQDMLLVIGERGIKC